jgi:endonuclease V-like protein UPF0215 family
MKDNPITIGFDDAAFQLKAKSKDRTELIGVICQGIRMVGAIRKTIIIDGNDATEALIDLIIQTQNHVQYVLTDTITFAGFNICDLEEIYKATKKPIIAITEREVDLESVKSALIKKFPNNYEGKLIKIIKAGDLYESMIKTAGGNSKIYFHCKGITLREAESLFSKICIDSKLPECIRLAHIIGKLF